MIWALLFALLFSGSDSVFLNPKVKKHVESPERKNKVLSLLKSYEKEIKSFNKAKKKMTKELELLNADHNATEEAFKKLFNGYMVQQKTIDEKALDGRIKTQ